MTTNFVLRGRFLESFEFKSKSGNAIKGFRVLGADNRGVFDVMDFSTDGFKCPASLTHIEVAVNVNVRNDAVSCVYGGNGAGVSSEPLSDPVQSKGAKL